MPFQFNNNLVLISKSNDAIFNMSLSNYLTIKYNNSKSIKKILLLSSNSDCVSIGITQNCYKECNLDKMKKDKIPLVRRNTGGGACFLDFGNRLFSFIDKDPINTKENNYNIIIQSLHKLGLKNAVFSGRNDICINNLKISGSAFSHHGNVKKHHGTILLNIDKTKLTKYLTPNNLKLESKGIKSVDKRIMNLTEINPKLTHDDLNNAIINEFDKYYNEKSEKITIFNKYDLTDLKIFNKIYENYTSEEYLFNWNPAIISYKIEHKFSFGITDILFKCDKNVISECYIHSDSIETEFILSLPQYFIGLELNNNMPTFFLEKIKNHLEKNTISENNITNLIEIYNYLLLKLSNIS
jgi:lipoate-protein ligase A